MKNKAKEILLSIVPKDCYWEDMDNLTNCPVEYVIEAMKQICEIQKQECANYISEETTEFGTKKVKHIQVLKSKNVCDE